MDHLKGQLLAGDGGDPGHEVPGQEGSDNHGAGAGWHPLQLTPVKVDGEEDGGHLNDSLVTAYMTAGDSLPDSHCRSGPPGRGPGGPDDPPASPWPSQSG